MESMAISTFKATCLAVLERVRQTGEPVLITKRGQPIAEIVPPPPVVKTPWVGAFQGTGRICGDIVAPAFDESDWDALRG